MKIDIRTNLGRPEDMDSSQLEAFLTLLTNTYKNIRADVYAYFLSTRNLRLLLWVMLFPLTMYFMTDRAIFLYVIPVFLAASMMVLVIMSELTVRQVRSQVQEHINTLKRRLEQLRRQEQLRS